MAAEIIAALAAIGIITALGIHSAQLATLAPPSGKAASGIIHSVETGDAS
jgi:hypothetical protein